MENAGALIVVAYPSDEAVGFSTVCRGSDVVAVGSGGQDESGELIGRAFHQAAKELEIRRAFYFDLKGEDPFPAEVLESKLRALGPYPRVYTHSPFDEDTFRVSVMLVTSRVFGPVWVQATGAPPGETMPLTPDLFRRKMEIVNAFYTERLRSGNSGDQIPNTALPGVEAFTQVSHDEVIRAVSVSSDRILGHPDAWGFQSSSYELERLSATCELLMEHLEPNGVKDILDIGACEGEMTEKLRLTFPASSVRAVESQPYFATQLRQRFHEDHRVTVLECDLTDIPLEANLIVLAEVLYYLKEEEVQKTLKRLQAQFVLVGCDGEFDLALSETLATLGWRQMGWRRVRPRFEPVKDGQSRLICCRQGTNVRLWQRVASP
jgi:hypothetical protein